MTFKCVETEKLYQRDSNLKKKDVEEIRRWLKKQKHLPPIEDVQIMAFLHKNHYEIEASQKSIGNYFTIRSCCPDVFTALDKDVLKTIAAVVCVNILPKKSPEGYLIVMTKLLDTTPGNYNCLHHIKLGFMVLSLYYHQLGFEKGVVLLFDMRGFSFGHLFRLNLYAIRNAIKLLQNSVKLKGVHFLNAIPLTGKVLALVKPFLNAKLYKKIQVHHPNSDTVYKFLPKECLIKEYGGDLPSAEILTERNIKNMLDNYEFYSWFDSQKIDGTKIRSDRKW